MRIICKVILWLSLSVFFCTVYSLTLWYGFVEPINNVARVGAIILLVSLPSYYLTHKIMKKFEWKED